MSLSLPAGAADVGDPETGAIEAGAVATGSAHAKFILIGEHAVVYGRPAIGIPVPELGVNATARAVDGPLRLDTHEYSGLLESAPRSLDALGAAMRNTLAHFGRPADNIVVDVHGEIPIGRGLGSSAAVAHAIVEAIRALLGAELTENERFELVQSAERVAHGTPSGLDACATRGVVPILFESGAVTHLDVAFGGLFVIADTGVRGSTKSAVGDVAAYSAAHPERAAELLDELERSTRDAAADLAADRREELGARMTRANEILAELGAGHAAIDLLVAAALDAGALGAKLTGGGQGGCIVALVRSDAEVDGVVAALDAAGADGTWVVRPARRAA